MSLVGIIGGTGLTSIPGLQIDQQKEQQTPYGHPSGSLIFGSIGKQKVVFLPRHGKPHVIPPHKVNYRANIWALQENAVDRIIAVNAVGGITTEMRPCRLVIPDQIIDYTYGRQHTFFEDDLEQVTHIDFSRPYCETLRRTIIQTAQSIELDAVVTATYGATQGPRLESVAEIKRMQQDGCDLVGMTGMPEAALARELNISYASVCVVVNWAAGKFDGEITMEMIEHNLQAGIEQVRSLLTTLLQTSA